MIEHLQAEQDPGLPFAVGDSLPELVLPSIDDGRPLGPESFHGSHLLLHFFASW